MSHRNDHCKPNIHVVAIVGHSRHFTIFAVLQPPETWTANFTLLDIISHIFATFADIKFQNFIFYACIMIGCCKSINLVRKLFFFFFFVQFNLSYLSIHKIISLNPNTSKAEFKQLKRKTSHSRYAWLTSKANYLLSLLV